MISGSPWARGASEQSRGSLPGQHLPRPRCPEMFPCLFQGRAMPWVQPGLRVSSAGRLSRIPGLSEHLPSCEGTAAQSGSLLPFTKLLHAKCLPAAVLSASTAPADSDLGCPKATRVPRASALPGDHGTNFHGMPWEPSWFQTQAQHHLICISPLPGSQARGEESWNSKPLCAYLLYDPVGCSVYSNPASIWIR